MNASELKEEIKNKQQSRKEVCRQAVEKFYNNTVQEMLRREILEYEISVSAVSTFISNHKCEVNTDTFIRSYLLPELKKNGFFCAFMVNEQIIKISAD